MGKYCNYPLTTQGDRFASCENIVSRSQTSSLPLPHCYPSFSRRFHAGDIIEFLFFCQYGDVITLVLDFRQRVVAFACCMVGENTVFFFKKKQLSDRS